MFDTDQPLAGVTHAFRATMVAALVVLAAPASARDGLAAGQAVTVTAAEAWEDETGRVLFVRGDLVLRAPDWELLADEGRIEGRLEDPDRIVVAGTPARIVVRRTAAEDPLEGRSSSIEFRPHADEVRLSGDAEVVKGRQSITSATIRYALDDDTFSAGLGGRVRVVNTPGPRGAVR